MLLNEKICGRYVSSLGLTCSHIDYQMITLRGFVSYYLRHLTSPWLPARRVTDSSYREIVPHFVGVCCILSFSMVLPFMRENGFPKGEIPHSLFSLRDFSPLERICETPGFIGCNEV